ncbi:hypothetical protein CEXT_469251 [Caerostris extrusa]|uniref:Uncharacterized protein n=1 Tax=Caerostris extrusa TaxID=172846 RepID=A0AAV4NE69_CAEEX|nr:hypothetical protein CEXT_469251 [Caerostris extrusa]
MVLQGHRQECMLNNAIKCISYTTIGCQCTKVLATTVVCQLTKQDNKSSFQPSHQLHLACQFLSDVERYLIAFVLLVRIVKG